MSSDLLINFYTKENPKKYEKILKNYKKEINEKLPNIYTGLGIRTTIEGTIVENIFGEEYYIVGVLTDYSKYCSYFYEDEYPIEKAKQIAKQNTQILIDTVKKVIELIQPEFGFGGIHNTIEEYEIKLEKKKYKNPKEFLSDITDNFTKLPWLFVYKEDLDIKIPEKVIWDETDILTEPQLIEKIGKCYLYILNTNSVAPEVEEDDDWI
ncbi:hypothetical protein [Methanococcus aeolicus]|uniref:Uncharacterized protein n=1 Tax=Methanococcus aeolicus (strain ATCC BAA-1280 / DSM 17508 / OCM 812 / Nankai-3) TaxID=419665 RepID=A6UVN1_META3|nr:hypothetical protein [Methanococcus aeolicus]ABR56553.1 hypothetical protein Maeo_0975 [Methanococcus aeolicus Nankai-3]UXM84558.1 hypothetical protein N6C89_07415 [Methanococcus aeolicus]